LREALLQDEHVWMDGDEQNGIEKWNASKDKEQV